jgi:hypothetical protein
MQPTWADYEMSRYAAIDGWEMMLGPVPKYCRVFTTEFSVIEVMDIDKCSKPEPPPGKRFVGCMIGGKRAIFIAIRGRGRLAKMDTAVHEYIHVLAWCIYDDIDKYHEDETLWDRHGMDTVEAVGCAELN